MSTSNHKQQHTPSVEERRQSEMSAPVSDFEYFQFSPIAPQPQTPVAPPQYRGTASPVSPPLGSEPSETSGGDANRNRLSTYENLPEVVPEDELAKIQQPDAPEYQMTPDHGEKEAYAHQRQVSSVTADSGPARHYSQGDHEGPIPVPQREQKRYPFGLTRRKFIIALLILVILILVIAVGVGVGVGVGTSHHKSSGDTTNADPQYTVGGALNPAYYSTTGAFNGSGVALADVNFGLDNSIYVFYQRYNGDIDQLIYETNGQWTFVTTVATDAKNATPLSTVAYIVNSVATWHLFYVSENSQLKQRVQSNVSSFQTNIWQDGPINSMNLPVYNANMVGMQACYWGNYYGSLKDYDGQQFDASNSTPTTGMNIWYAKDATTFEQYDWTNGQSAWQHTRTWNNSNAHAGVGCQSWLSNTTSYMFLLDASNTLRIYWKDIDTNKTSTPTHPIDQYTLVENFNVSGIWPSSSLGYTDFAIYQATDFTIHGVNITWAAENTTIAQARQSTKNAATSSGNGLDEWALLLGDRGLPGTHMAITGSQPASGGKQEWLFYQRTGNDLMLGTRDAQGGSFSFITVPVGDSLKHGSKMGSVVPREEEAKKLPYGRYRGRR